MSRKKASAAQAQTDWWYNYGVVASRAISGMNVRSSPSTTMSTELAQARLKSFTLTEGKTGSGVRRIKVTTNRETVKRLRPFLQPPRNRSPASSPEVRRALAGKLYRPDPLDVLDCHHPGSPAATARRVFQLPFIIAKQRLRDCSADPHVAFVRCGTDVFKGLGVQPGNRSISMGDRSRSDGRNRNVRIPPQ